jgi:hypothetical protein
VSGRRSRRALTSTVDEKGIAARKIVEVYGIEMGWMGQDEAL